MSHELLFDYHEGVLEGSARKDFERHLEGCADCRDELTLVRRLEDVVRDLPEPELPEGFHQRLQAALDTPQVTLEATTARFAEPAARPRWPWALLVLVVVALGLWLLAP